MDRSESKLGIAEDQVDLWYVQLDRIIAAGLEPEYWSILSAKEVAACDRFTFVEGRRQCLVSRVLVRTVLSSYTGDPLSAWEFHANPFGKPAIVRPAGCPLQFNLSHTTGLVLCAVSLGGEVGVDVEDLRRPAAEPSLASSYFTAEEVSWLEAVPAEQRQTRFLQLWTLKEAFIKAKGEGLSIPLNQFAFSFPADGPPQVEFRNPNLGLADQWQFAQFRLDERFQMAVASHLPGGKRRWLRSRWTVPLRAVGRMQTLDLSGQPEWLHSENATRNLAGSRRADIGSGL